MVHTLPDVDEDGVLCLIQGLSHSPSLKGWFVRWFDGTFCFIREADLQAQPSLLESHELPLLSAYFHRVAVYDEISRSHQRLRPRHGGTATLPSKRPRA